MSPPRRLIVVDDDSNVRLLLQRAFRAPEFETHTFASGSAALRYMGEVRPDCVVSDVLMPDMDGERLLHEVRAVPGLERVPFIALSAVRSEARIRALLTAGADAFLVKPFPVRDLIEKVRTLLIRPRVAPPVPGGMGGHTSVTRPVLAVSHTMSTTAVRPTPPVARFGPASELPSRAGTPTPSRASTPPPARPLPSPPAPRPAAPPGSPAAEPPAPARIVAPTAAPRTAPPFAAADVRHVEIGPPDPGFGFGRFTRVEVRGRSFVVLTEAVAAPMFTVTTVVTEKGVPLRKIDTALPHPLARDEDRDCIRRQLDLQHDDVLRRLGDLVLDASPRRVVWSDLSRSVDANVLAWAISAVAQLAETEAGTDEVARQLRLTHERALVQDDALRALRVTPLARVVPDPRHGDRLPRRAVSAVAAWCRDFAVAALQAAPEEIGDPVRQATRRHSVELERMGFYDRLRPAKA